MPKARKEDVDYSPGMRKSHCGPTVKWPEGDCEHFLSPDGCERVEGTIKREMWCRLFKKVTDGHL